MAAAKLSAHALVAQSPSATLRRDLQVLAADSLGGRFTGSREARQAAEYIARRFRELGLRPAAAGAYLQPFAVSRNAPAMKELRVPFALEGVNVAALLPGTDPTLRDEFVIVGAHYDHLGLGGYGASRDTLVAVHNGADDNASGTVALFRIAEQLKRTGTRRSVLFLAFSGEELGLLGSQAYVRSPLEPLARTVAMVNLDMVGRLRNGKLIVYGTGTAAEFPTLLDSLNAARQFDLRKIPDGFGPSDHSSFFGMKRPVLHLFTDLHDDYHRSTDDVEKINFDGLAQVAGFAADVVRAVANRRAALTFQDQAAGHGLVAVAPGRADAPASGVAPRGGARAWFGSIPDMAGDVAKGVLFSGVSAGSPAEKAGLMMGDILVRIGDSEIADLQAMTDALNSYKPGDVARVVVLRGGREHVVDLTFAARAR